MMIARAVRLAECCLVVCCLLVAGCGSPAATESSGAAGPDGAPSARDGGATAIPPVDAGPVDAGPVDAGPADAGPVDAGPVDEAAGARSEPNSTGPRADAPGARGKSPAAGPGSRDTRPSGGPASVPARGEEAEHDALTPQADAPDAGAPRDGASSGNTPTPSLDAAHEAAGSIAEGSSSDWPMWGRTPSRNMVQPHAQDVPVEWDEASGASIRWRADLGDSTYGNPVVGSGYVIVGTNNGQPRDAALDDDRGVVMCFRAADGEFLWQYTCEKLPTGQAQDWPLVGICSSPAIDEDRVYFLNSRAEVVCLNLAGQADGQNDGPTIDESRTGPREADVVWTFDLIGQLGVSPHNMASSNPLVVGDRLYLITSNGVSEDHTSVPAPEAPSFVCFDKRSGELLWEEGSISGSRHTVHLTTILHGQWASPGYGVIETDEGPRPLVFFPGGDGWLYALRPESGELVWKYDCNPPDSRWIAGGRGDRNELIATPVAVGSRVYIATGQDPEHGGGPGTLHAIDATLTGDITHSGRIWMLGAGQIGRSLSTVAVADGLVIAAELDGFVRAIDAESGEPLWEYDALSQVWGSPLVVDGRIYLGDEDGDVAVLALARELDVLAENTLSDAVYGSPVAAGGVLYVATQRALYAIAHDGAAALGATAPSAP